MADRASKLTTPTEDKAEGLHLPPVPDDAAMTRAEAQALAASSEHRVEEAVETPVERYIEAFQNPPILQAAQENLASPEETVERIVLNPETNQYEARQITVSDSAALDKRLSDYRQIRNQDPLAIHPAYKEERPWADFYWGPQMEDATQWPLVEGQGWKTVQDSPGDVDPVVEGAVRRGDLVLMYRPKADAHLYVGQRKDAYDKQMGAVREFQQETADLARSLGGGNLVQAFGDGIEITGDPDRTARSEGPAKGQAMHGWTPEYEANYNRAFKKQQEQISELTGLVRQLAEKVAGT
jgi:hypothetical protein